MRTPYKVAAITGAVSAVASIFSLQMRHEEKVCEETEPPGFDFMRCFGPAIGKGMFGLVAILGWSVALCAAVGGLASE